MVKFVSPLARAVNWVIKNTFNRVIKNTDEGSIGLSKTRMRVQLSIYRCANIRSKSSQSESTGEARPVHLIRVSRVKILNDDDDDNNNIIIIIIITTTTTTTTTTAAFVRPSDDVSTTSGWQSGMHAKQILILPLIDMHTDLLVNEGPQTLREIPEPSQGRNFDQRTRRASKLQFDK